jgi:hypothetical protein
MCLGAKWLNGQNGKFQNMFYFGNASTVIFISLNCIIHYIPFPPTRFLTKKEEIQNKLMLPTQAENMFSEYKTYARNFRGNKGIESTNKYVDPPNYSKLVLK